MKYIHSVIIPGVLNIPWPMDFFQTLWETSHSEVKKQTPQKNINTSKVEGDSKQNGRKGTRLEFLTLRFICVCFLNLEFDISEGECFSVETPTYWKNTYIWKLELRFVNDVKFHISSN